MLRLTLSEQNINNRLANAGSADMKTEINTTVVTKNSYEVITGKTGVSKRTATRVAYERKRPSVKRSFFPAAELIISFSAQSAP